jgi:hypothetical protein
MFFIFIFRQSGQKQSPLPEMGTILGKAVHQQLPLASVAPQLNTTLQFEQILAVAILKVNNSH